MLKEMICLLSLMAQIGFCSASSDYSCNPDDYGARDAANILKEKAKVGDVVYTYGKSPFGHVGIIIVENGEIKIREAMPIGGVITTDVALWFCKYNWIALLRAADDDRAQKAAEYAKNANGRYSAAYFSKAFDPVEKCEAWCDESQWYCSELVYKAYKANGVDLASDAGYSLTCVTPDAIYNNIPHKVAAWEWTLREGWHEIDSPSLISKDWMGYTFCGGSKGDYCCECGNVGLCK
jgi:uncharacterized protein YycO